jgi:hypothetical protein
LNEIGNVPGEFAEQIAVQIIHLRANQDSDPHPVAPDPTVSNDGHDLPRVRIENDVLRKEEILSHGVCSLTVVDEQSLWFREDWHGHVRNPLMT